MFLVMITLFSLREVEIEIITILAENLLCKHSEVVMVVMVVTPVLACDRRNDTKTHNYISLLFQF